MRLFAAAAVLCLLGGCKGNCRQLSEKLCECSINSVEKDACLRRVSNSESIVSPKADAELTCGQLLAGCDCHTIDTPEGKRKCGLAR